MKVLLVHDWLTGMRGGERCLEVFCELFPEAPLATLLHEPGSVSPIIENRKIFTSPLQRLSLLRRRYRHFLPLLPTLMQRFDTSGYDLIISSSHCVAKMIPKPAGALHWCYLYTPMRYVWDLYKHYFGPGRAAWPIRLAASLVAPKLRQVDRKTSAEVDRFVAISHHVADRVQRHYQREAAVIYPPVDIDRFLPVPTDKIGDWDLIVSAFAPYKRVDLAITAANHSGRKLKVVGSGQDEKRLRALAGPSVEFLGMVPDVEVASLMARCRTFIFPGEEDFGITPVEAQAAGRPVVFYATGGATETVTGLTTNSSSAKSSPGGVGFGEQTAEALLAALERCDAHPWDPQALRRNAKRFDRERFKNEIVVDLEAFAPGAL